MTGQDDILSRLRDAFDPEFCEPGLGWPWVYAFEAEHHVELPEPYRSFLAGISGSGGGPPYYGLERPGGTAGDLPGLRPGSLTLPFAGIEGEWSTLDTDRPGLYEHGLLPLGTNGCGMSYYLVVSGDCRGQIWYLDEDGIYFDAPDFATWCLPTPPATNYGIREICLFQPEHSAGLAALYAQEGWPTPAKVCAIARHNNVVVGTGACGPQGAEPFEIRLTPAARKTDLEKLLLDFLQQAHTP